MIKYNLEKDLYIILFEGHLEANKILEKDRLLELETTIQNTCKINFHINLDENYIIFHGYGDNILNSKFNETLLNAVCIIKNMLDIYIKYGEITITECKEEKSYNIPHINISYSDRIDIVQYPTYKQYILYLKQT
jgi:hypothetical protein